MKSNITEGLRRGRKTHGRAVLGRFANDLQRCLWHPMRVSLLKKFALTANSQLQRRGQRIDNRHANTMQTAGNLIGIIVKFPAGMENRHDHFSSRYALLVLFSGYPATIIRDRH